jgi:hypothetical protein
VQLEADSRQVTEDKLRELRQEERDIYDSLENHNETLKSKILRIAQVIEERINLLDPMLPKELSINQISSIITRQLRAYNMPFAHWVSEYLPDKYKNPNIHKHTKLIIDLKDLIDASVTPTELIEQSSNIQLESLVQYIDKAKNVNDDLGTILKNRKEIALQEAIRRGMKEIAGEKIRDQISCYDFRMRVPDNETLHWYNKQTSENLIATGEAISEFGRKDFLDFPPHDEEIAKRYTETSRIWRILFLTVKEKKWSGDIGFWMDRNYHQKVQSSHDSGNSTKYDSTLCAWCSRDIDNDPLDRHIMQYDRDSPTTYRCDNCGGTAVLDKGNSREQVGDKKEENDRFAEDIINHAPFYSELFGDWRKRWLNPTIYGRKRAIQEEFSIASMGKDKTVVPRKKQTKG